MAKISLIMPVHASWARCRPALDALRRLEPAPAEVILVADGAMDGELALPADVPAQVLSTGATHCSGAASARNLGASRATGDILLFIDSDVVVPADLLARIAAAFRDDREVAAVFGSYDDSSGAPNFLSQYKNLLHHFTHQTSRAEASTFWTGCGAIRAEAFRAVGGFTESLRHLEDVELGSRLKRSGYRVRLCHAMQVKHLKQYSALSLLKSDVMHRAVPWSRAILGARSMPDELSLRCGQRWSVIAIALLGVAMFASLFSSALLLLGLFPAAVLLFVNRDFYIFLARRRGIAFLALSLAWHWVYFFYAGSAFAYVVGEQAVTGTLRRVRRNAESKRVAVAPDAVPTA